MSNQDQYFIKWYIQLLEKKLHIAQMCQSLSAIAELLVLIAVKRFADQPPSASPLSWTVPTGAKNAFI